jgi:HPt (histidine-containing phosphotransfer) domain-containing protein
MEDLTKNNTSIPLDKELLDFVIDDIAASLPVLDVIIKKQPPHDKEDLASYDINIHGIKSVLANIEYTELAAIAYKLEMSVQGGNAINIPETSAFLDTLKALLEEFISQKEN